MNIIASQFYQSKDAENACNYLVKEAAERWQMEQGMVDDITIIVAFLNVGGMTKLNTAESQERNTSGVVPAAIQWFFSLILIIKNVLNHTVCTTVRTTSAPSVQHQA